MEMCVFYKKLQGKAYFEEKSSPNLAIRTANQIVIIYRYHPHGLPTSKIHTQFVM